MDPAGVEKLAAAEWRASVVRLVLVAFAAAVYVLLMDPATTIPWLAYLVLVSAGAYSAWLLVAEPYLRFNVMLSSVFVSATDAGLISLWLVATGPLASPFYLLWYASLFALALRYGLRESMAAAALYAAVYAALLWGAGVLFSDPLEVVVRIGFLPIIGLLGGLLSEAALEETVAKREYQELAEELERSNEELARFAHAVSHDLREPLRMVTSYLGLVERRYGDNLDEEGEEFVGYAVDGAKRMDRYIKDLLAYSRVGTEGGRLEPVDAEAALDDARKDLEVRIKETGAEVTHGPLPAVMADASQLTEVFQNLIGNAVKFRRAEVPPRVHVSATRVGEDGGHADGGMWRLSVEDNGQGIAEKDQQRLFQVFQRGHGRDVEGTGMGLALCKRIVERHGGTIWLESEPGEGTTVRFTLPAAGD